MGGGRMARQQVHGLVDFCQAGAGDAVAQELLVAVVVARRIEQEQPVLHHLRAQLGPAGGSSGRPMPRPVRMRASSCTSVCV